MMNAERWTPSKFVVRGGRLAASRDPREVYVGSRLAADLVAQKYDRWLAEHARGRLADLGCGKVPLYDAYRRLVSEVICADLPAPGTDNPYLDVHCDLCEPLPFPDRRFDTVILSDVLEHLPEPAAVMAELARILDDGGKLLLNAPFLYGLHDQPRDFHRYTEFALRRLVDNAGLELLLLEPLGGAPEVLSDILAKNLLRMPKLGRIPAILLQAFASAFIATRFGRKVSDVSAADYPFGYFLVARKPGG